MARNSLSNVDTAWLRMEDPTNLMMITGVMIFGAPIDFERLKATLVHRLLRFDRFRQRVVQPRLPLRAYAWEDDPLFDINHHLHRIILPRPGDRSALEEVTSELMSTQLDYSRPLWEIHLIERFGDGCALIARLHHSIADGIALVRVLLSLTDPEPDMSWPTAPLDERSRRRRNPFGAYFQPAHRVLRTTVQVTEALVQEGRKVLEQPAHALDLARQGTRTATALARLLLLWPDPKTRFKGTLGVAKRAAWSEPIPLSDVKAVGRAMGGTVNDVLLTAVTGALRRYLQTQGDAVDDLNFRAVVPVNLRPADEELTLGNNFGLVFLSLPIGIADPVDRLRELKQRMDELKGTPEAMVAFGILNAIGMATSQIQDIVVDIFGAKGTSVMTNVPGPRHTIYLAGAPLDTIMFWVPQSGRLGLGVSILSYAGKVWLGVATDRGLVPDPQNIIGDFHNELGELFTLTQQRDATPAPKASFEAMSAMLEETIRKVTVLIEDSPARGTDTATDSPSLCTAQTRAGRRCRNRPATGSRFCYIHQTQKVPADL